MSRRRRYRCIDCDRPIYGYMVTDAVWKRAGLMDSDLCCLLCLEQRLRRPLSLWDFPPLEVNTYFYAVHGMLHWINYALPPAYEEWLSSRSCNNTKIPKSLSDWAEEQWLNEQEGARLSNSEAQEKPADVIDDQLQLLLGFSALYAVHGMQHPWPGYEELNTLGKKFPPPPLATRDTSPRSRRSHPRESLVGQPALESPYGNVHTV